MARSAANHRLHLGPLLALDLGQGEQKNQARWSNLALQGVRSDLIEIKVELILRLPHDANIAGQLFINKHA